MQATVTLLASSTRGPKLRYLQRIVLSERVDLGFPRPGRWILYLRPVSPVLLFMVSYVNPVPPAIP